MTVLVTGAGGGIGRVVVRRLLEKGEGVRILRRPGEAGLFHPGTSEVVGDLLESCSLEKAVEGIDALLHLAGVTHSRDPDVYFGVNVNGTRNLLKAIGKRKIDRLAVGAGGGAYSLSKMAAEEVVRNSGAPWVIFRPAEVYGTGGGNPVIALAGMIRRWPFVPVIGDGRYRLSPVHVDDVAECLVRGLREQSSIGRTYTLAGPDDVTFNELIDLIAGMLGQKRPKVHVPVPAARALFILADRLRRGPVRDQLDRLLLPKSSDTSSAARDLDFRPAGLKEKLRV